MPTKIQKLDASRGTAVWGINRWRSDALVSLLDDLMDREEEGLEHYQCKQVQIALGYLVNAATSIPDDAWWRGTIWRELQEFSDAYERWNSHEGKDAELVKRRKQALVALRKRRNRIATKIRKHQYIIQNELDLKLVDDMYRALGALPTAFPELFKKLGSAVRRFRSGANDDDKGDAKDDDDKGN